jgi:hypothetical protein
MEKGLDIGILIIKPSMHSGKTKKVINVICEAMELILNLSMLNYD